MNNISILLAILNLTTIAYGTTSQPEALVIIDMQPDFERSERVLHAVIKEIDYCIERKGQIVVVEYEGFRPSYPEITNRCKNYPNVVYTKKPLNNGSKQILKAFRQEATQLPHIIRVVGGYAEQCLEATVVGLSREIFRKQYDTHIIIPTRAVFANRPYFFGWGSLFKNDHAIYHVSLEENGYDDSYTLPRDCKNLTTYTIRGCMFFLFLYAMKNEFCTTEAQ